MYINTNVERKLLCSGKTIGEVYGMKMYLILATLVDTLDRLEWKKRQENLLTYQEYVIFKGLDTIIDEHRICIGLKWNVQAAPFYPKIILKPHKEPSEENCTEELNDD